MIKKWCSRIAGVFLALATSTLCAAGKWPYDIPEPATTIGHQIYDLHILIMYVVYGIFVVVFGAMFYSLWKHRKSVGHQAHQFHENTIVEVLWTIIPFFILIGMAYPATKTVLAMKDTSDPDMTIKITGYQWKWEYDYMKDGVRYFSTLATPRDQIENRAPKGEHYLLEVDNPMVIPTGKKVRLLLTANDVIHAWWIPEFGVKQDAIPGFIKDAWVRVDKPGIYRGQCAELCGKDHAYMPIVVEALEPAAYDAWIAGQKTKLAQTAVDPNKVFTPDELKASGEKVYAANCAACHGATGAGVPGVFPAMTGSKIVTGPKDAHINIVFHGKPGTAMAAFGKQLSDADIAAVVTFERNALGNQVGDMVQPSEVKALRDTKS